MTSSTWVDRTLFLAVVALCSAGVVTPVQAQKPLPAVTQDADRDGVPDNRDRCRNTPAGTRVDASGCPTTAAQSTSTPNTPTPTATPGAATPAATAAAAAAQRTADSIAQARIRDSISAVRVRDSLARVTRMRDSTALARARDSLNQVRVRDSMALARARSDSIARARARDSLALQNARAEEQRRRAQMAPDPNMTAGYWMPMFAGTTSAEMLEYGRTMVLRLDSAVLALRETFVNTTGTPMTNATSPTAISNRERSRWSRCRLIKLDLDTYGEAAEALTDSALVPSPSLRRAAAGLAENLEGLTALSECDVVASMIDAPDRYNPWQQNYERSAQAFYREWYPQLRAVHESARALARALSPQLGAGRAVNLMAIPTTPPTVGGR